eukprot:1151808-Pelagomonas_calceolata.AAC.1
MTLNSASKVRNYLENTSLYMLCALLCAQDLPSELVKRAEAVLGNVCVFVGAAGNSALPMVLVISAPLGSTRLFESLVGSYTPAPITVLPSKFWQLCKLNTSLKKWWRGPMAL